MVITDENFEGNLDKLVDLMGIESLFPSETRAEDYKHYFNDESSYEKWLNYPYNREGLRMAAVKILFLEQLLEKLETQKAIEYYEREGAEYKVRTSRYDIYLRVLHSGEIAQYTVNRKTNKPANYSISKLRHVIKNNLEKYL